MAKPSASAQYLVLLRKDLRRELRTFDMLGAMGIYAVLVLIVFGVALSQVPLGDNALMLAAGLFWCLVVLTCLLGLNRSFAYEQQEGCLEGLLLAPLDPSVLFLAKATSNLLFLGLVELVSLPVMAFLLLGNVAVPPQWPLALAPLVAGTVGIALVGTLLSSVAAQTRGKDVMLAALLIPLAFPLLQACVGATMAALGGPDFMDAFLPAMTLICAYDVIMGALSWLLYGFTLSV